MLKFLRLLADYLQKIKKKCVSFWLLKKKLIKKKIKLKTVERKLYNCSQQLENTWNEMKFCVFKTFKTFIAAYI